MGSWKIPIPVMCGVLNGKWLPWLLSEEGDREHSGEEKRLESSPLEYGMPEYAIAKSEALRKLVQYGGERSWVFRYGECAA